jgi:hypothetical protein
MAGVRFQAKARHFSLLQCQDLLWGPMGTGGSFSEVKCPGREADHSPRSRAEVKNVGAITPLPNTSPCRSAKLIKHRDNFTFHMASQLKEEEYSFSIFENRMLKRIFGPKRQEDNKRVEKIT